ncbi:hypothetical protein ACXZ1K_05810 [Pedobacter sp. PWIIR3]
MLFKILGINLLILVAYTTLIVVNSAMENKGFNIAIGMGLCAFIQFILNVVTGFICLVIGKRDLGKFLLISAAILVPVSFVSWLILLSIYG